MSEGKKILCSFCHQPIHIDHWGGVAKKKGIEYWYCDNICCLVEANEKLGLVGKPRIKGREVKVPRKLS